MSDILEDMFPDGEVVRYIQYNGNPWLVNVNDKEVIYISPSMSNIDYRDVEKMRNIANSYKQEKEHWKRIKEVEKTSSRPSVLAAIQECKREIQEQGLNQSQVRDNSNIKF